MDYRILLAAVVGLVLIASGAFYFALGPRSYDISVPVRPAVAPPPPGEGASTPAEGTPGRATAASIETEIAHSGHGELQALLKRNFTDEYNELVEFAVRRRNEGTSNEVSADELNARFQEIMRPKLKFAAAASAAVIDRLAKNEIGLFHALGTEGADFCPKVLGRDSTPATAPLPDGIRRMMRLGTFHRFEAIVDGMPKMRPVEALSPEEMGTFEAALARNGLRIEDVRSGAFLEQSGNQPGRPCLMIEKLYTVVGGLPEETRRKLYIGMYFLGRDK